MLKRAQELVQSYLLIRKSKEIELNEQKGYRKGVNIISNGWKKLRKELLILFNYTNNQYRQIFFEQLTKLGI